MRLWECRHSARSLTEHYRVDVDIDGCRMLVECCASISLIIPVPTTELQELLEEMALDQDGETGGHPR